MSRAPFTDQTSLVEVENRLRSMRLTVASVVLRRRGVFDVELERQRDGKRFASSRRSLARALDEALKMSEETL